MKRLAFAAVLLVVITPTALAQLDNNVRYVAAGEQTAVAEPQADAPVVARLSDGSNLYILDVLERFVRVDASGVAGPAYLPIDGVRAEPIPKSAGRCACPHDVNTNGHFCGGNSAFCREGGREVQCGILPEKKSAVCGAAARVQ